MTVYDFSSGFNSINNAFANIGKQNEIAFRQQALAALGQDLASGDYASAAQKALASGDPSVGIAILGLGQKADERKREADWYSQNSGLLGGAPSQPLAAAGKPSIPSRGVQVAENEADTQRLEAQASGLTQLGQPSQPRGLRNNNPGNIEAGRFTAAQPGSNGGDGRFARFDTPEAGIKAADNLLRSYAAKGLNTISGIVGRWAPPGENDTGAYVATVARELGVDPNAPLDMNNPQVRQKLIAAKIRVENGQQPYAEDVFQRALNPNWQTEVASFEGGAQPVQVAQAPGPQADVPAPGASPAQGFAIPGTTPEQTQAITSDPQVRNLLRALDGAPEKFKASIKQRLDLRVEELKQARTDNKLLTPEQEAQRIRMAQAGRTQISNNVDMKGETAEAKKIGESAGTRAGETMAAAASASKQLMRLGQVEALMKNVETGKLQPGRMSIAALGKSLGVDDKYLEAIGLDPKGVGDAQALNAISGRMLVDMIGSGGFPANNFSNTDREFLTGTLPSLANDPRANSILVEVAKRAAKLDIEKAKGWREWKRSNPKGSFDDYELEFGDRVGATDMFADLAQKAQALGAAPAAKPAAAAPSQASDYLRANPNLAAEYDAKYGPGSAAKVLGQ